MKDDIVIVSAVRTPVGAFNGAFAALPAHGSADEDTGYCGDCNPAGRRELEEHEGCHPAINRRHHPQRSKLKRPRLGHSAHPQRHDDNDDPD